MIAEAKYLFKAANKRLLAATLVFGLVVTSLPIAATYAEGVSVVQGSYLDGAGSTQGMNIYTTGGANKPGIIFVHGGGWRAGDKNQYDGLGHTAAQRGYVGISINYRLGSAGVYYQYEDVMRAVTEIRTNAAKYGVNPNRLAIWGDSAGGSLAMRIAASGESGLAAAVGWSAPVNAYTAIFNSLQSFAIGIDHSTCIPTDMAAFNRIQQTLPASAGGSGNGSATPISEAGMMELLGLGKSAATTPVAAATPVTPVASARPTAATGSSLDLSQLAALVNSGVTSAAVPSGTTGLGSNIPTTQAGAIDLSQLLAQFSNGNASTGLADNKALGQLINGLGAQTATPAASAGTNTQSLNQGIDILAQAAGSSNNPQLQQAAGLASQLAQSSSNNSATPSIYDPKSANALDSVKAAAARAPSVAGAMHTADAAVGPEVQKAILAIADIFGCQDNFRVLSPTLTAGPKTPPTFLANAQNEFLVHPGQALEYRDKLRGMGVAAEALILPGENHMGYDERAVAPTFSFLDRHLR